MLHVLLNVVVGYLPVVLCFIVAEPIGLHCEEIICCYLILLLSAILILVTYQKVPA